MTGFAIYDPSPAEVAQAAENAKRKAAEKPRVVRRQSDAKRFAGEPVRQWAKLEQAMTELLFYRASGRHHTEREVGGEVRSHAEWKRQAVALARAVADAIVEGGYEPLPQPKPTPEPVDVVDDIDW